MKSEDGRVKIDAQFKEAWLSPQSADMRPARIEFSWGLGLGQASSITTGALFGLLSGGEGRMNQFTTWGEFVELCQRIGWPVRPVVDVAPRAVAE